MPTLLLTGCFSFFKPVPVERKFPDVPAELKEKCPELKTINNTEKLSEVVDVVTSNYGDYNKCRNTVDGWNKWYNDQKKIFESVK